MTNKLAAFACNSKITSETKLVALVIAFHANPHDGSILLSPQQIGEMCGALPVQRVYEAVQELCKRKQLYVTNLRFFGDKWLMFLYQNGLRTAQFVTSEPDPNDAQKLIHRLHPSLFIYIYKTNPLLDLITQKTICISQTSKGIFLLNFNFSNFEEITTSELPPIQNKKSPLQPNPVVSKLKPSYVQPHVWSDWIQYRKETGHPMTPSSAKMLVKKLDTMTQEGHDANQLLTTAIEMGWRSVYPPKMTTPPEPKRKFI